MKGLRSTLLLLVVLLGLGGYIYFQGATPTDTTPASEKLFAGFDASKLDELTVKAESGDVTQLRKTDGIWSIVSPVNAVASETEVSGVTSAVEALEVARVVDEAPTDVKEYGLDAPRLEVEFKGDGGKLAGKVQIGGKTATGGNLYARKVGEQRVVLVGTTAETALNRSTFDLREKRFVKLDRAKVDAIELQIGGSSGELVKKGEDWTVAKPAVARADTSAVDGLFATLDATEMKSVVTAAPTQDDLKKYGLETPVATVALRSGTDRRSIAIGGKADETSVYVRDSSKPDVYTVDTATVDTLKKAVEDYRRKELFDFRAFSATHVELTRGGQTVVLERVKATDPNAADTWKRLSPNPGEPDRSKVENMLATLADIRATAFVASKTGNGLASPVLTVSARFDEGKKEERVVFGKSGADAYAARPDDPGAAKIEASKLDDVLKALDEIGK
jgi:hypothetical protein